MTQYEPHEVLEAEVLAIHMQRNRVVRNVIAMQLVRACITVFLAGLSVGGVLMILWISMRGSN